MKPFSLPVEISEKVPWKKIATKKKVESSFKRLREKTSEKKEKRIKKLPRLKNIGRGGRGEAPAGGGVRTFGRGHSPAGGGGMKL